MRPVREALQRSLRLKKIKRTEYHPQRRTDAASPRSAAAQPAPSYASARLMTSLPPAHSACCVSICTFVLGKQVNGGLSTCCVSICTFCTSKASKLSTCFQLPACCVSICTFVLGKQVNGGCFGTSKASKASKLSTCFQLPACCVSICTFVLGKQVNGGCFCTSKASKAVN